MIRYPLTAAGSGVGCLTSSLPTSITAVSISLLLLLIIPAPVFTQFTPIPYISTELSMEYCQNPSYVYKDDRAHIQLLYALCDSGILRQNATGGITTIHDSAQCNYGGAIIKPSGMDGAIIASCYGAGIFSIDDNSDLKIEVVNSTVCGTAMAFAFEPVTTHGLHSTHNSSDGFVIAACDSDGVIRINLSTYAVEVLLNGTQCQAKDVTYFLEDGMEFVVAACVEGIFKLNLSNRSVIQLVSDTDCDPSSVSRSPNSGLLFAACTSSGVMQINGTVVTNVVSRQDCAHAVYVRFDDRLDVLFLSCLESGTIAFAQGQLTTIANLVQCPSPRMSQSVEGGFLTVCFRTSILRIASSTVAIGVPTSTCSSATLTVVDSLTGAVVSSCPNGIVSTQNNVDVLLADITLCGDGFTNLKIQNLNIYASCAAAIYTIDRISHRSSVFTPAEPCEFMEGIYPDSVTNRLFYSCYSIGVYEFDVVANITRLLVPYSECGSSYTIEKDPLTNSLFVACDVNGVRRVDLSSGVISAVVNSTECSSTFSFKVGNDGIVYVNCIGFESDVISVNASSGAIVTVATNAQLNGYSSLDNTIFIYSMSSAGVFAFDMTTNSNSLLVAGSQCPTAYSSYEDPTTLSVWTACGEIGVLVSTKDFRCHAGSYWSSGVCVPCGMNTFRPYSQLQSFGSCISCPPGYITMKPGSTDCTPCPIGTYESNKICLLCSLGKYQNANGSSACLDCEVGSYALQPGSSNCTLCSPGFFSSTNGSVACSPCNSGSASNVTGLSRPCDGCPAGTYQPGVGQHACLTCPPNTYSEQANSTTCTRCANQVNEDQTACTVITCDPNSQFNVVTQECELCPLSQYSARGGFCTTCTVNTYTPGIGSGCAPCDGIEGLICSGGIAQVKPGFWAFLSDKEEDRWPVRPVGDKGPTYQLFRAAVCPNGFCSLGTPLQLVSSADSALNSSSPVLSLSYCAFPRLNSVDNTLCAQCETGYLAWGSSCITCNHANGALVFAYLVLSFALVLFLLYSSSNISSAGSMSIFLFFIQTCGLELGPIVKYIDWIQIFNFDPKSAGSCLAPWSAYVQTLFALLIPVILIAELMVVAVIHYGLHNMITDSSRGAESTSRYENKIAQFIIVRIRRFSLDDYVVGTLSILIFCYTQVSTASFSYLNCVNVGHEHLNFSAPTIDCSSTEYKAYLVPVLMTVIVYVVGFPLVSLGKLWRNRESLYTPMVEKSRSSSVRTDNVNSAAIQSFLHHWSPFYRMYHPRAYFWQCTTLLRRAAFVVTAVLLMQQPSQKFMVFVYLHFASLLLHLYVKPYEMEQFNHMESASYVLLVCISVLLTANVPPAEGSYPLLIQILLFIFVVPPSIWMFGVILMQRYKQWRLAREDRIKSSLFAMQEQIQREENTGPHDSTPAASIESIETVTPAILSNSSASSVLREHEIELSPVSDSIESKESNGNPQQASQSILPSYALNSEDDHHNYQL